MAEIIYQHTAQCVNESNNPHIRWLCADDLDPFNSHLRSCGQCPLSDATWNKILKEGTIYCGLFIGNDMVARACVEKYSDTKWEVADVRTVKGYRNRGFAFQISNFVLQYILAHGKIATIRTEDDNWAMQKVISKLGFTPII